MGILQPLYKYILFQPAPQTMRVLSPVYRLMELRIALFLLKLVRAQLTLKFYEIERKATNNGNRPRWKRKGGRNQLSQWYANK